MKRQEWRKLQEEYRLCRANEIRLLGELENCNHEDEELIKELVPVQQRRAQLVRILQID